MHYTAADWRDKQTVILLDPVFAGNFPFMSINSWLRGIRIYLSNRIVLLLVFISCSISFMLHLFVCFLSAKWGMVFLKKRSSWETSFHSTSSLFQQIIINALRNPSYSWSKTNVLLGSSFSENKQQQQKSYSHSILTFWSFSTLPDKKKITSQKKKKKSLLTWVCSIISDQTWSPQLPNPQQDAGLAFKTTE